jgi:rhodanese-related sulfurtransferase
VLCHNREERAATDAAWIERLGYDAVSYLEGGVDAWKQEGFDLIEAKNDVHATAFNYKSKSFGEQVNAKRDFPKITPEELAQHLDEFTIVDVRSPHEYEKWGTIPGSVNVEGVDVALYAEAVQDDDPLVLHCAGRTRSIIGTATLQELGFSEVYELENGTMGWQLAGYDLAEGSGKPNKKQIPNERRERLRGAVSELLADSGVSFLEPEELDRLDETVDERQAVYRFDVRTKDEFIAGHLPGAWCVPGGQLIQTAGRQLAVRNAEIVLISDSYVRSGITAYWLDQMGFLNVRVLRGGITAWSEYSGRL